MELKGVASTDHGVFSALDRLFRQRHEALFSTMVTKRNCWNLVRGDWVLCCAHDIHNALKWAVSSVADPDGINALRIVLEPLRNSLSLLLPLNQFVSAFDRHF